SGSSAFVGEGRQGDRADFASPKALLPDGHDFEPCDAQGPCDAVAAAIEVGNPREDLDHRLLSGVFGRGSLVEALGGECEKHRPQLFEERLKRAAISLGEPKDPALDSLPAARIHPRKAISSSLWAPSRSFAA